MAAMLVTLVLAQIGTHEVVALTQQSPSRTELDEYDFAVSVWCDSAQLDVPTTLPAGYTPRWSKVRSVVLTGCGPSTPPDPPALSHALKARGVRPEALISLQLKDVPPSVTFSASHFTGLDSLTDLTVQAAGDGRPQQLTNDVMQSLLNVTRLSLKNEALPPLPAQSRVRVAQLVDGQSLGAWGGCKELLELHLRNWLLTAESPRGWLVHCERLKYLHAERISLESLRSALYELSVNNSFITLELKDTALTTPELAALLEHSVTDLEDLRVPHNNLTHIDTVLDAQKNLKFLDLSHNMLSDPERTLRALNSVPTLRQSLLTLWLDHNPLRQYCAEHDNLKVVSPPLPNLMSLSLAGTKTERLCFSNWSSLNRLNLSFNNIEELQFGQLPLINNKKPMTVTLYDNPLRDLHFNEPDYNALNNSSSRKWVMVNTDSLPPLNCECRGWLERAMREGRVRLTNGVLCRGGGRLLDAPPEVLECDLIPCDPCQCRRNWVTLTLRVHCEKRGLQDLPELPNVGELHLRRNQIHTIRTEDLPKTLTLLDLRDNNVTRVDAVAAAALFEILERHVWLSGNPIACDCDNWPLLGALQAHFLQVEDFENVTCSDGRSLQDMSEELLCGIRRDMWPAVTAGGSVLIGLVALSGALYARYKKPLKVWLYAHGWCLFCVREEELDEDREFDAFLSFAHGDHEFVAEKLLPGLEGGRCHYKVCVHYRDWTPGELIPIQIARSVAASRRTVIVLSAHFVRSVWGLLEFRTAHVSALAEGRVRLLVVALDDAPPTDELPEELRVYLRSTTYLSWNDPWFWNKLRYALPHRSARDMRHDNRDRTRETNARASGTPCGIELMLHEQKTL